jgi:hypothetical protein
MDGRWAIIADTEIKKLKVFAAIFLTTLACSGAEEIRISSLKELSEFAALSGNSVTMEPGKYPITDLLTPEEIARRKREKAFAIIDFSGSDNTFLLNGVVIEYDTAVRTALRPPQHSNEFLITGNSNRMQGLSINCSGDGTSPGGALFAISGKSNTLHDCTLLSRGSYPYGYGDLFGKGGAGTTIGHAKHSGLLITGDGTRLLSCRLFMHSFGHGYFLQEDAADVTLDGCTVEGVVRPSDEILAETEGPAQKIDFRTTMKTRGGKNVVLPGYMKSLSEDGFRTYGDHPGLVMKNCTSTNMRGGFEIRSKDAAILESCSAIGNERGFWISNNAVLKNCKGDARYGPLLYVEGSGASVDLTLLPESKPGITVHNLAAIYGKDNRISIKPALGRERQPAIPIMIGYGPPPAGENMSNFGERDASGITLENLTTMPIIIGEKAKDCAITSKGKIAENKGEGIVIAP